MSRQTPALYLLSCLLLSVSGLNACAREETPAPAPQAVAAADGRASTPGEPKVLERRVVRRAELRVEVRDAAAAYDRAVALTEKYGGFVANASRHQTREGTDQAGASTLVLKVPGTELTRALADFRRMANGSVSEQIASDDVTDEVLDVEAHLRNQRRLEDQLLELLKTANTVEAALKVHQELANARSEIERLEGRKQFLDRQTSFATIELSFAELPRAVSTSNRLADSVSRAWTDARNTSSEILIGSIRVAGVLVPLLIFFGTPFALLFLAVRKLNARKLAKLKA